MVITCRTTGKVVAYISRPKAAHTASRQPESCWDDQKVIDMVNRNHEIRLMQDRLNEIAKKRKGGSFVQNLFKMWRKPGSRRGLRLQRKSRPRAGISRSGAGE